MNLSNDFKNGKREAKMWERPSHFFLLEHFKMYNTSILLRNAHTVIESNKIQNIKDFLVPTHVTCWYMDQTGMEFLFGCIWLVRLIWPLRNNIFYTLVLSFLYIWTSCNYLFIFYYHLYLIKNQTKYKKYISLELLICTTICI